MRCPYCGSCRIGTFNSRKKDGIVRRQRDCKDCKRIFRTVEILEDEWKKVTEKGVME